MSAAPVAPRSHPSARCLLGRLLGLTTVFAVALPVGAQSALEDKAVVEYRLTEGALKKGIEATTNLAELMKRDAALSRRFDEDDHAQWAKHGEERPLADIVAGYERFPPVRRAITNSGLSTTEYATFMFALAVTELAILSSELGEKDPSLAPAVKANLTFRKRHEADIERLEETAKALELEKRKQRAAPR